MTDDRYYPFTADYEPLRLARLEHEAARQHDAAECTPEAEAALIAAGEKLRTAEREYYQRRRAAERK
jgi:hypothetical protein